MRKIIILLLICLYVFPSITVANTKQTYADVPLCEMTPYKFLDRLISRQDSYKLRFYDIHKSAQSGEFVLCKVGTPIHYCYVMITAEKLPSGLTRLVRVSRNDSSPETLKTFSTLVVLIDENIGLSYQEVMLFLKQDIPSPYKQRSVSSIWKDNRRIIGWYEIVNSEKSSLSFYAVNGPKYIR